MSRRAATALRAVHSVYEKDRVRIASDGTPIAYAHFPEGDRVPVLCVNGWSCPDAYWKGVLPGLLERGHPALVPDVRGAGRSGLPRDPGLAAHRLRREDVTVERLARDVIEVLDDAGIARAALVGHSMGVQILFETYRLAPGRVAALVPIAGAFENPVKSFADRPVFDRIYPWADVLFRLTPWEWLRPAFRRVATPERARRFARAIGLGNEDLSPDHLAPHVAHVAEINFSVLWRIMAEMRLHSAADVLPRVEAPVLILAGALDYMTPPSVQRRMYELLPRAELVWFEDGTHLLPVDVPEAIVREMARFLANL